MCGLSVPSIYHYSSRLHGSNQSSFGCDIRFVHFRSRCHKWRGCDDHKKDNDGLKALVLRSFHTCLQLHTPFYQSNEHTVAFLCKKGAHHHSVTPGPSVVAVGQERGEYHQYLRRLQHGFSLPFVPIHPLEPHVGFSHPRLASLLLIQSQPHLQKLSETPTRHQRSHQQHVHHFLLLVAFVLVSSRLCAGGCHPKALVCAWFAELNGH